MARNNCKEALRTHHFYITTDGKVVEEITETEGIARAKILEDQINTCPDDFKDPEEEIASFTAWVKEFTEKYPNATNSDLAEARRSFYVENNCAEALKRHDDYISGNVDEQTRRLIETVIKEEMLKKSTCPFDFKDRNERNSSFVEWEKEFRKNNPSANISDMAKARKQFYIENNCKEATERPMPKDYGIEQTDQTTQQLLDIIENYNL